MKRRVVLTTILLLTALFAVGTPAQAATLEVCPSGCVYSSIQAAVDAASPGDLIRIRQGTYDEMVVIDKDLTLVGQTANQTIIAPTDFGSGSAVTVISGITVAISGVTITNGRENIGAGIYNEGTLALERSSVTKNFAGLDCAGIYNEGVMTLRLVEVTDNLVDASFGSGGGICNENGASITLQHSLVRNNKALAAGGISNNGLLLMQHSQVVENRAAIGTGISNSGTLMVEHSLISGNVASTNIYFDANGGGIYNSGTATLKHSFVRENTAAVEGGGIYNDAQASLTLEHALIMNNTADVNGGGIFNEGSVTLEQSLIRRNSPNDCVGC